MTSDFARIQHTNSGAFGADRPHAIRGDVLDDRGRIAPEDLPIIWNDTAPHYAESRKRILFTNDVTSGKKRAPVPRKHARNRDIFAPLLPSQVLRSLHNHNVLARKEPRLKRYTSGTALAPLSRATRIEQWANPMTAKLCSWDELSGMLQTEGEMGAIVCAAGADWLRDPPPFKARNAAADDDPLPEWWRDADGLSIQEYLGREEELRLKRDGVKTRDAYEQALFDWEVENPAIRCRLIHAEECVPIGLRIDGDGPKITGLLVRSLYTRVELMQRQFIWGRGPTLDAMTCEGPRDVEMLEGWLTDAYGLPYVVYCVQGMATRWKDGNTDDWAMIDLHEKYGQNRQFAFYEYGWHRPTRDPGARGMPFAYPFASGDLAAQAMVGAAVVNFWNRGHGARGIRPDPGAPREAYMDGSAPRKISWEPGGDIPVLPGEVIDMLPQVISPDAWRIIDTLQGANDSEAPSKGSYGGAGPESGRERTIIRRYVEDAESHILDGALRMWQKIGSGILELGALMTERKACRPIPVPAKLPIATDGRGNKRRGKIIVLDPMDCQRNYELEAYFQPQPGDNLALAEQAKGLVQAGLRPRRWFHETIMGDESPEQTEAEIISDHLVYGDEGQAEIRELAAQIRNDEREKDRGRLRAMGKVAPSGAPLALGGGLMGPGGPAMAPGPGGPVVAAPALAAAGGPGPVGVSPPTSPQGMLGGQVSADIGGAAIRGDEQALGMGVPG